MADFNFEFAIKFKLRKTMTAQENPVPLWLMTENKSPLRVQFYDVNWDYFLQLFRRNRGNEHKTLYQNIFDIGRTEDFHITYDDTFQNKDMQQLQKQMDHVLGHILAVLRVQTSHQTFQTVTPATMCALLTNTEDGRIELMNELKQRIGCLCPNRNATPTVETDDVSEEDLDIFCLDYTISIDKLLFMKEATQTVDVVTNVALTTVNGKIMVHYRFIDFHPKKVEEPPKPKPRRKPKRKATRSVADILNAKPNKLHRPRYKLY